MMAKLFNIGNGRIERVTRDKGALPRKAPGGKNGTQLTPEDHFSLLSFFNSIATDETGKILDPTVKFGYFET